MTKVYVTGKPGQEASEVESIAKAAGFADAVEVKAEGDHFTVEGTMDEDAYHTFGERIDAAAVAGFGRIGTFVE